MLFGKKYRAGLRQRLTLYTSEEKEQIGAGLTIWVHTVSVGELLAARPFLQGLKNDFPHCQTLVTTVTETGQTLARECPDVDRTLYLPLDVYPLCKRMLKAARPLCGIIFETEIWPNLIRAASRMEIPLILVNARLSDRSFKRYRIARSLFAPVLDQFTAILAQSETDVERFRALHAPADRLHPIGNIKFEAAKPRSDPEERNRWRGLIHIGDDEMLLLGGSTFPGEERILHQVMESLREEGIPLRLAIAPRHVERIPAIANEIQSMGAHVVLRSQVDRSGDEISPIDVILLDSIGELSRIYAAADIVFMGKSLKEKGGQNPLEPAAWGRAIVHGPNMQNFRDIAAALDNARGSCVVEDETALLDACRELCKNPARREAMGAAALNVVKENQGVLSRIQEIVNPIIHERLSNS